MDGSSAIQSETEGRLGQDEAETWKYVSWNFAQAIAARRGKSIGDRHDRRRQEQTGAGRGQAKEIWKTDA